MGIKNYIILVLVFIVGLLPLFSIVSADDNGTGNYADLSMFTNQWPYIKVLLPEDLDRNGIVNFTDFAIFANNWMWEE